MKRRLRVLDSPSLSTLEIFERKIILKNVAIDLHEAKLTYVFMSVISRMNFLKWKRDSNDQELIDAERDPKKLRTVVSLVRKVGNTVKQKLNVALKALTSRTYSQDVKSTSLTTPAGPLRSTRYIMMHFALPFTVATHTFSLEILNPSVKSYSRFFFSRNPQIFFLPPTVWFLRSLDGEFERRACWPVHSNRFCTST